MKKLKTYQKYINIISIVLLIGYFVYFLILNQSGTASVNKSYTLLYISAFVIAANILFALGIYIADMIVNKENIVYKIMRIVLACFGLVYIIIATIQFLDVISVNEEWPVYIHDSTKLVLISMIVLMCTYVVDLIENFSKTKTLVLDIVFLSIYIASIILFIVGLVTYNNEFISEDPSHFPDAKKVVTIYLIIAVTILAQSILNVFSNKEIE